MQLPPVEKRKNHYPHILDFGDYDSAFDSCKKENPIQQAIIIKATENNDGELVG